MLEAVQRPVEAIAPEFVGIAHAGPKMRVCLYDGHEIVIDAGHR